MADEFQDKTEEASSKKLIDARKKGQVGKSQDLTTSFVLIVGMIVLFVYSHTIFRMISSLAVGLFNNLEEPYANIPSVIYWSEKGLVFITTLLAPILGGVFVMAMIINISQVKFIVSPESLKPKWSNINIFDVKKYKKFFELQALMRLLFGLLKLSVVGGVCYSIIIALIPEITRLIYSEPEAFMIFLSKNAFIIGLLISVILIVLGIFDFAYQKWKFARDQKMTKQEVKEERKQSEGDVHVKAKLKSMMQSFAQSRMKTNVPKSDVIIANPIHYAIAIKYDPETMVAPLCFAKGARKMAIAIKEIAKEHKIPIVENPPLARSMYKVVEVGQLIPANFYHVVAEVLAYVYRLNEKMDKKAEVAVDGSVEGKEPLKQERKVEVE